MNDRTDPGDGELFTGVEDAHFTAPAADLGLDDPVSLGGFLAGLTYREVHAFVAGFAPLVLGISLLLVDESLALVVLGAAVALTVAAHAGRKVENRALRAVVQEPHYLLGGQVLGGVAGSIMYAAGSVGLALFQYHYFRLALGAGLGLVLGVVLGFVLVTIGGALYRGLVQ